MPCSIQVGRDYPVGVGAAFNPLTEIERAGAHALAQGAFAVIRGGNFWQGAAAGLVSSLGGSAFQAFCPPAIANSVIGVTAFSAIMGGAGAYLGGARSPEEILMGVAAGAMSGALNHELGAMRQRKSNTLEEKLANKLKNLAIGKSITGEELGEVLGNDNVALAVKSITRVNQTTFKVERTMAGLAFIKNSPMTIEKTTLKIDGKSESVFRIRITYTDFAIKNNQRLYKLVCY